MISLLFAANDEMPVMVMMVTSVPDRMRDITSVPSLFGVRPVKVPGVNVARMRSATASALPPTSEPPVVVVPSAL